MVLVWPDWFGLDHNDLVTTIMKWSWPKWIGQVQIVIHFGRKSQFGPDQFWSRPFHFGGDQIIMVNSKSIWSHRRTRHKKDRLHSIWLNFQYVTNNKFELNEFMNHEGPITICGISVLEPWRGLLVYEWKCISVVKAQLLMDLDLRYSYSFPIPLPLSI